MAELFGFLRMLKKPPNPAVSSFPHGSTPVEWMAGMTEW